MNYRLIRVMHLYRTINDVFTPHLMQLLFLKGHVTYELICNTVIDLHAGLIQSRVDDG